MLVLNPDKLDGTIYVEESLARALDMYSTRTTPRALANYVGEQAAMPKNYQSESNAIRHLVAVALALTPPESGSAMDFSRRAETAARDAVPSDYAQVMSTLMELGWGNSKLEELPLGVVVRGPGEPVTVREVGEQLRAVLLKRTAALATRLLEKWESEGLITRF